MKQADAACSNSRDVCKDGGVFRMQVVMGFDGSWVGDERDRMPRALRYHELGMEGGMIVYKRP